MSKEHKYSLTVTWTGNKGPGTSNYRSYSRDHTISAEAKGKKTGSSDPSFQGDQTKYNPEDMLVYSLSACHMLWYLHLCAESGVIVTNYIDNATGIMTETKNGSGKFDVVTLNPTVTIQNAAMVEKAKELHHTANNFCFIANSVNFPVIHKPIIKIKD